MVTTRGQQFGSGRSFHVLNVFDGRLLDPVNQPEYLRATTAYNAQGVIVSAPDVASAGEVAATLREVLDDYACRAEADWIDLRPPAGSDPANPTIRTAPPEIGGRSGFITGGVLIVPTDADYADGSERPDPWTIVQGVRSRLGSDATGRVGLNHLMTSAEQVGGNPFALGHGRSGLDGYGIADGSGRGPVVLTSMPRAAASGRRPRVVVLDTAAGDHEWFRTDPLETTFRTADGGVFGPDIASGQSRRVEQPADDPTVDPVLGTLKTHVGHGTFIAGLLRQTCPEADIVALSVMQANGVVPEHKLIRALELIRRKQSEEPGWADALVLSLGYYAETGEDLDYTSGLKDILVDLATLGVAVFAAAGNDATGRPSFPAAFAGHPEFKQDNVLPLVSVAALNPDGSVAIFSNDGPWVTSEAVGVNLISVTPTVPDASAEPWISVVGPGGQLRSTVDPDDLRGFAVWSGTSFAAPVLAGGYLNALVAHQFPTAVADRKKLLPVGRRGQRPLAGDTE